MLWHDNLSLDNIFVDSEFVLTGILDWECVSCLPIHQACHLPAFMQMRGARHTELPYTAPTEEEDAVPNDCCGMSNTGAGHVAQG